MNFLSLLTIIALSGAIVLSHAGSSKLGVGGHPGGGRTSTTTSRTREALRKRLI